MLLSETLYIAIIMNCCTLPFFYVAASLYVSYNSGLGPAHLVPVIFPHSENTLATVASAYLHDPAFLDCHNPDKTEPVQVADVLEHIRKILFQRNVCATVSVPVPNSWRFTPGDLPATSHTPPGPGWGNA